VLREDAALVGTAVGSWTEDVPIPDKGNLIANESHAPPDKYAALGNGNTAYKNGLIAVASKGAAVADGKLARPNSKQPPKTNKRRVLNRFFRLRCGFIWAW
jgi:hypothetical protein